MFVYVRVIIKVQWFYEEKDENKMMDQRVSCSCVCQITGIMSAHF